MRIWTLRQKSWELILTRFEADPCFNSIAVVHVAKRLVIALSGIAVENVGLVDEAALLVLFVEEETIWLSGGVVTASRKLVAHPVHWSAVAFQNHGYSPVVFTSLQ